MRLHAARSVGMSDSASETALSLREMVATVMTIRMTEQPQPAGPPVWRFRGDLLCEAQLAHDQLAALTAARNYTPLLQPERNGAQITLVPTPPAPAPSRLWVALLLFVLTVLSTAAVGGVTVDPATLEARFSWLTGLGFSAALLGILLTHELGHFLVARHYRVAVSYPMFIPMPLFLLGTMGAFISIKEPLPNRRVLLAIGIAGPLAGLIVAVPVLLVGLSLSEVRTIDPTLGGLTEGNSLLYAALKVLMFGRMLPVDGIDVYLHPVAFAGWAGLLMTGLNLLPAGQLDGGHVFTALFGPRAAEIMNMVVPVVLIGLGFIWDGWFLWAIMVALLGRTQTPLRNSISPLTLRWRALAWFGLIVFLLVFTPLPLSETALP
jgi:membrane-associated protease RseP (regulator of RpoE activity)